MGRSCGPGPSRSALPTHTHTRSSRSLRIRHPNPHDGPGRAAGVGVAPARAAAAPPGVLGDPRDRPPWCRACARRFALSASPFRSGSPWGGGGNPPGACGGSGAARALARSRAVAPDGCRPPRVSFSSRPQKAFSSRRHLAGRTEAIPSLRPPRGRERGLCAASAGREGRGRARRAGGGDAIVPLPRRRAAPPRRPPSCKKLVRLLAVDSARHIDHRHFERTCGPGFLPGLRLSERRLTINRLPPLPRWSASELSTPGRGLSRGWGFAQQTTADRVASRRRDERESEGRGALPAAARGPAGRRSRRGDDSRVPAAFPSGNGVSRRTGVRLGSLRGPAGRVCGVRAPGDARPGGRPAGRRGVRPPDARFPPGAGRVAPRRPEPTARRRPVFPTRRPSRPVPPRGRPPIAPAPPAPPVSSRSAGPPPSASLPGRGGLASRSRRVRGRARGTVVGVDKRAKDGVVSRGGHRAAVGAVEASARGRASPALRRRGPRPRSLDSLRGSRASRARRPDRRGRPSISGSSRSRVACARRRGKGEGSVPGAARGFPFGVVGGVWWWWCGGAGGRTRCRAGCGPAADACG
uniref:Collagen alpha-1(III) chain-like n=1 Tax=Castor canadensis TaxID=51338 RepID=A0A8B7WK55_CASCN|nr:collagen alpha-1(III) chain-like [Castor canadensis]